MTDVSKAEHAPTPDEVKGLVSRLRDHADEFEPSPEAMREAASMLEALSTRAGLVRNEALEEAAKYHDAEAARMRRIWKDGDHSVNEDIMRHDLFASRIRALKSSRADSGRAPATEGAKS